MIVELKISGSGITNTLVGDTIYGKYLINIGRNEANTHGAWSWCGFNYWEAYNSRNGKYRYWRLIKTEYLLCEDY